MARRKTHNFLDFAMLVNPKENAAAPSSQEEDLLHHGTKKSKIWEEGVVEDEVMEENTN